MKLTTLYLSVLGLTLLLAGVDAWAQGGALQDPPGIASPVTIVKPVATYTGLVADVTKMTDAVSPITDQATLSALWTDWGITKPQPIVDFTTQLVVVSITSFNDLQQNFTLNDKGNLTVDVIDAGNRSGGGFRYVISVISNTGITSVNGVALPVPVPILRSAAFDMSISKTRPVLTVTDEKTWMGLWGTKVAPVTVDFTKEEALLVTMEMTNANYSVAITGVTETAQRITATATATAILTGTQPGLITPSMVAIIPKSDKPVYFTETVNGGAPWTIVPIINTITATDSLQKTPDTAVIKDVAAWKELYDKEMPAGTALPEVDFGKDMALVVFAGLGSEGRTISQVIEVNGKLQVDYYVFPLHVNGLARYPWTAVIVPKSDFPVTFMVDRGIQWRT